MKPFAMKKRLLYAAIIGVLAMSVAPAWDDAAKTLTFGPRKGDFPGPLKERTYHIVWASANHASGIASTGDSRMLSFSTKVML